jgi:hypothetical protein
MSTRRMRLRKIRIGLVLALVLGAVAAQASGSLALFTETRAAAGNGFVSASWIYYLHNNPTPPTAATAAQANLAMNATVAAGVTLYSYANNCSIRTGRRITRAAPSPAQGTLCNYQNWRSPALPSAVTIGGAMSVDIWSATDTANANRTGGIVAYLRDFNPAGAGTYTEIANGLYSATYAAGRTFYHYPITVNVATAYTLPAGHQLELKLVASNAYQSNMLVAYDTTTYPSFLRIH